MKKRLLYSLIGLFLFSLSAVVAIGQSTEVNSIMASSDFFKSGDFINLSVKDNTKEIPVFIKKGTSKLTLQMGGIIKSGGGLSIQIFDPNGKKQDGFGMSNPKDPKGRYVEILDIIRDKDYVTLNKELMSKQTLEKKESTNEMEGQFLREFLNPIPGKWVVKVVPQSKDGKFKVNHIVTME